MFKKVTEFFTKMVALTGKVETLEVKVDSGFQRIDQRIDSLEKRLDQKIDYTREILEGRLDRVDESFKALSTQIDQGFAQITQERKLVDRIAGLTLDVERLKAAAKL